MDPTIADDPVRAFADPPLVDDAAELLASAPLHAIAYGFTSSRPGSGAFEKSAWRLALLTSVQPHR
jgi:maleate isomerase